MPLLKDSIPIVTTPPTPQAQLAAVIKELQTERARLARLLNNLLQIMGKVSPENVFVLKCEARGILLELDILLDELASGGDGS
jgi:hypothetical protein